MRRIDRRTRRCARGFGAPTLSMLLACACIDTDFTTPTSTMLCIQRNPSKVWPVVSVDADLGALGVIECSGVAISPRIILTHLACLVLPSELLGEVPSYSDEPYSGSMSIFPNERDYRSICGSDPGRLPPEDGSFSVRLEEMVATKSLEVSPLDATSDVEAVGVRKILTSGAVSRCSDDLAALVLDDSLNLGQPSLRMTDASFVGEPVTMVGLETQGSSEIERVTLDEGDETTPPRAFTLARPACLGDTGGGVFSDDSQALIGIVELGVRELCDEGEGETVVMQISPYRALLVAAAKETGDVLYVEPDPGVQGRLLAPDCPSFP